MTTDRVIDNVTSMYAWHFLPADKCLRYGERDLVKLQRTIKVDPAKIKLCEYGLHASQKPIDALGFVDWKNPVICRVKLSGKILVGADKVCASERKVLWWADTERTLHEFACWCAEQTLYIFERDYPDDKRPRAAIQAKRDWLAGKIDDKQLDAAWAAARAAARDAAWDAARAAARDAARAAAWAAATAAAWDAAWAAAWDAARAAAWAAATAAAWAAAWDAQNKQLGIMLMALKPERAEK